MLKISKIDKNRVAGHRIYFDKQSGYSKIVVNGERIYLHRFITNAKKGQIVDHINRDRNDNRRENLRIVSRATNNYNKTVSNSLGRGIYFDKYGNRYRACLSFKNKTIKLGSFKDLKSAKIAYNKKAFELHGSDAFQHKIK